jgi:hypothetical protein
MEVGYSFLVSSHSVMFGFLKITNLETQRAEIVAGRYGVIDVVDGRLRHITLRPWPKIVSVWESLGWGEYLHRHRPGDRCRIFYNQPRGSDRFLALKYFLTTRGISLRSFHAALDTLDEIARIKQSVAIVCEAANLRLNERIMRRYGWEQHTSKPRNYIKRFYGSYPVKSVPFVISSRAELVTS